MRAAACTMPCTSGDGFSGRCRSTCAREGTMAVDMACCGRALAALRCSARLRASAFLTCSSTASSSWLATSLAQGGRERVRSQC